MSSANPDTPHQQQERDKALFKKLEQTMIAIRKDPSLYISQVRHYISLFQEQFKRLTESTQKKNERFGQLTVFLCRCSSFYKTDMKFLAEQLMELLSTYASILHPYNRRKAVAGLLILRSKNVLFPVSTIQFLLSLMGTEDKTLRKTIYKFIVQDMQRMNKHKRNNQINRQLLSWIHEYVRKNSDRVARKMINLCIDLYKKNIWTDAKVVNVIATGCTSQSYKIRLISSYFLISTTEMQVEESDSEDDEPDQKSKPRKGVTKMTKAKEKNIEKQKRKADKKLKRKLRENPSNRNLPIDLIYNPHQFSEKLYSVLNRKQEKFAVKIVVISLLSRMIFRHGLVIMPFYSLLQRFLTPSQKQVGRILACFAQSIHPLIPESELQPIIKHIIEQFVNDRCSEQAMTMGLNTLREVVLKNSGLLDSQMMLYLCTYYEYKNKNVAVAAKSLINAVRQVSPDILEKRYRGRADRELKLDANAVCYKIDGAELLGEDAEFPVYMDRILSDDDFRRIRALKRRKEADQARQAMRSRYENDQQSQSANDPEVADPDQQELEHALNSSEDQQGEVDDQEENQWETVKEGSSDQAQQELEQVQQGESEIDWDNAEQLDAEQLDQLQGEQGQQAKRSMALKQKGRKRKPSLNSEDQYDDQEEEQDLNPHGFINPNRIMFYKKSRGEIKAEKRQLLREQGKKKFVHQPKVKGGGTNDKQKQKNKPLMMLRPKKNKQKLHQKQVKSRIKELKNRLGKAKSGKKAKQMRTKKIKKN